MGRRWKREISDCIESWKERALGTIEKPRKEERKWMKERKVAKSWGGKGQKRTSECGRGRGGGEKM